MRKFNTTKGSIIKQIYPSEKLRNLELIPVLLVDAFAEQNKEPKDNT